jgi:hypothetical protein
MGTIRTWCELLRVPNIPTAWADVAAGSAAAAGFLAWSSSVGVDLWSGLGLLLLATTGLYGGGVILNDFFDAELDRRERPERPIPSARARRQTVGLVGFLLLGSGVGLAGIHSATSGIVAAVVAALAVTYDAWGKRRLLLGPALMGSARGGNLLLGVSILPGALEALWFLAALPLLYIAAVTMVSRGEVHGGRRGTGALATGLILVVIALTLGLGVPAAKLAALLAEHMAIDFAVPDRYSTLAAAPFAALLGALVLPVFVAASRRPGAVTVRSAVRRGVLSLPVMNASLAAGFAGWRAGVAVILVIPLSLLLARYFPVT